MSSIAFQRLIDKYIGNIICFLIGTPLLIISFFTPKKTINEIIPKRILVIKLWAIGESILTLPMIHTIKSKFPNSEIIVLARNYNKEAYLDNKDISEVILAEPNYLFQIFSLVRSFDLVFDCEPYFRISAILSWWLGKRRIGFDHTIRSLLYTDKIKYNDKQHVVKTHLDLAKVINANYEADKLIELSYSEKDLDFAKEFLKKSKVNKNDLLIGLSPSVAYSAKSRMWPIENYSELASKLIEKYKAKIIFVGAKNDKNLIEQIISKIYISYSNNTVNAAGELNLKQFFALSTLLDLMISNDSGPMHISAAQGIPTIGLFCPNTPVRFAPYGKNKYGKENVSIYKPIFNQPCINVHEGQIPNCNNHDHMSKITVSDVFDAAEVFLKNIK